MQDMVDYLEDSRQDADDWGNRDLRLRAIDNELEMIQGVSPITFHQTPLMNAVRFERTNEIIELIENGVDVNIQYRESYTALINAIGSQNVGIVQLLLDAGADPNIIDINGGGTPLSLVADITNNWGEETLPNMLSILYLLLSYGGDPNIGVNAEGETFWEMLEEPHRSNVVQYISELSEARVFAYNELRDPMMDSNLYGEIDKYSRR
jgi:ankyrin repeat protein